MYRRLIYLQGLCAKLKARYGAADEVVQEVQRELDTTRRMMREDLQRRSCSATFQGRPLLQRVPVDRTMG